MSYTVELVGCGGYCGSHDMVGVVKGWKDEGKKDNRREGSDQGYDQRVRSQKSGDRCIPNLESDCRCPSGPQTVFTS